MQGICFCFNTQPPEGGWTTLLTLLLFSVCFNTQPPEGGWLRIYHAEWYGYCFNTQPPEGGWVVLSATGGTDAVSTHSRPKAAGYFAMVNP